MLLSWFQLLGFAWIWHFSLAISFMKFIGNSRSRACSEAIRIPFTCLQPRLMTNHFHCFLARLVPSVLHICSAWPSRSYSSKRFRMTLVSSPFLALGCAEWLAKLLPRLSELGLALFNRLIATDGSSTSNWNSVSSNEHLFARFLLTHTFSSVEVQVCQKFTFFAGYLFIWLSLSNYGFNIWLQFSLKSSISAQLLSKGLLSS